MKHLALCLLLAAAGAAAQPDAAPATWPDKIVSIDRMRPLDRLRLEVPRGSAKTRPHGTVVLRLHIDETGMVRRTGLVESSQFPELDEVALRAFQGVRFTPYREDGVAMPVTAVAPLHFPKPPAPP